MRFEGAAFPRDAHDPQPHLVHGIQPRTAELVDKPSRPDSPVLLAARLVYELHTVFLPMVCIAYNLGGMENVVAGLAQVRMGIVVAALISPIAWWAVMYKFRGSKSRPYWFAKSSFS